MSIINWPWWILIAKNDAIKKEYEDLYYRYTDLKNEIKKLESSRNQSNQDLSYIKFQLEELERIPLDNIIKQELIDEHNTLSNSEHIINPGRANEPGISGIRALFIVKDQSLFATIK